MAGKPASERPHVVSIGNLEAGGNGKTPFAIWMLARVAQAKPCAYVSRGYGGANVSSSVVTCVLAQATSPASLAGLRVLARNHADLAAQVGDEGALVCERVPLVSAFFCTDKVRAVQAATACGADLIVLDDAFQSWRVPRHTDIVLLDSERPLDGGQLLPAGRLREKPDALSRADQIIFNGAATPAAMAAARASVERWLRPGVPVAAMERRIVLTPAEGSAARPDGPFLAVSAIARPEGFEQLLRSAGATIAAHAVFPDHHRYDAHDVDRIAERSRRARASAIVTTEKDWVKLQHFPMPAAVWIARLDVSLAGFELPV
jgi:tetraacyldisaccharide 4'-kinase